MQSPPRYRRGPNLTPKQTPSQRHREHGQRDAIVVADEVEVQADRVVRSRDLWDVKVSRPKSGSRSGG